jgi:error-prone DNA polymerase
MGFYAPHTLVQDARRHGVEVRTPDLNLSGAGATLEASGPAVRLGLGSVRGVGDDLAERIAAGRPYRSIEDLQRRIGPGSDVMEALATAGAFGCFDVDRRSAPWPPRVPTAYRAS